MAMWSALEGIASTTAVRHGVLIIFSQNVRGRLGIFCNRYISGAVIESSGVAGLEAVRTLLAIKSGMFGFRACMGDEWTEVGKQSLGLDLHELLIQRNPDEGAETALRALMMPGSQLVRGSDLPIYDGEESLMGGESLLADGSLMGGDLSGPVDSDAERTFEPVEAETELTTDSGFSYLDWFADQMGQRDELPKFRQILMTAAPAAPPQGGNSAHAESRTGEISFAPPQESQAADSDVALYGRLLQSEQDKVNRDIERSLERGRLPENGTMDDAVSDLQLLSDFIEAEKERAQRWVGLDEIPTPAVDVMHSGAHTTAADVLRVSQRMTAVNFEETKSSDGVTTPPAPPRLDMTRVDVTVHWWQMPAVITVFVSLAFGLIAYAILTYQGNSTFHATIADARRGLRDNPGAAAKVLTDAIASQPGNPRGYFYRGIAYGAAGDYEKSVHDLDSAYTKGEEFKLVELAKAAAGCRASKYVEAIASCDAILRRDPNNSQAKALRKLAEDLEKAAQPPSVVAAPASEETPSQTKPATRKSSPLDKSIISDALPSQTKLPTDPRKLIQLGYNALRDGDRADAADLFAEAVKRAPNNPDARRYLAHTLAEQGNQEGAAGQFSALVSLGALTPRDVLKYAEVLEGLNKSDSARQMLAHFVETSPNDLNIRTELLRLYAEANMKADADALYNASLQYATSPATRAALDAARGGSADEGTIHIRRR